jgi:hypothetical protein
MRAPGLLAFTALLLAAPPAAAADSVLLKDDAEGAIETLWALNKPESAAIQPWQKSDSDAVKVRGNQAHGGATSYWAGSQPQDFQPADVVSGEATMTTKQPILIPADGKTTISLFSLFQNEGDDQGLIEAAVDTGGKLAWKKVAAVKLAAAAAGDVEYTPGYCDPTHPADVAQQGFEELKGTFEAFAGKKVFIRVNMKYGAENRAATQPCGWYVDDLMLTTTGTPGNAGAAPTTAAPATPAAAKPEVAFGALKLKGKKARFGLAVSGAALKNVKATLFKGSKAVGSARASELPTGKRTLVFKLTKKLKKGSYTIKLTATDFSKTGKVKGK